MTCYLWNETEGKRGSNEIGTCLYQYLQSLPNTDKHVCFYSDSCSGQNRNQYMANMLHHAVCKFPNIEVIDHKFLETGHTQMECDSVHATIEHTKKATSIFVSSQWDTIITMARRNKPYIVVPLKFWDILALKSLHAKKNYKVDTSGRKVKWCKLSDCGSRKKIRITYFSNKLGYP